MAMTVIMSMNAMAYTHYEYGKGNVRYKTVYVHRDGSVCKNDAHKCNRTHVKKQVKVSGSCNVHKKKMYCSYCGKRLDFCKCIRKNNSYRSCNTNRSWHGR